MALGTKGFQAVKGDLVRVNSDRSIAIPNGTISRVSGSCSGQGTAYTVEGWDSVHIYETELELLAYVRRGVNY